MAYRATLDHCQLTTVRAYVRVSILLVRRGVKNIPQTLLTYGEVAELLRCSVKSVTRLIACGELPVVKIGRMRRVKGDDVAYLIRDRRVWSRMAR